MKSSKILEERGCEFMIFPSVPVGQIQRSKSHVHVKDIISRSYPISRDRGYITERASFVYDVTISVTSERKISVLTRVELT